MFAPALIRVPDAKLRAIEALRVQIGRIQGSAAPTAVGPVLKFGVPSIEAALPKSGLTCGALHEAAGAGLDTELGALPAMFIAGLLAQLSGPVLWVVARDAPFCPAFAAAGFDADRLLIAKARKDTLLVMEEGLRHPGLAAVVGEVTGRLDLTASRRLQLAAEASGVTAFALRRSRRYDDPVLAEPNASLTRWRVSAAPAVAGRPYLPGLERARWKLDLARARGGEARSWLVAAPDATGRFALDAGGLLIASPQSLQRPGRRAA